jgi:hypothetical protein
MKRYKLLFSINGGAYAIVTWAAEHMATTEKTIAGSIAEADRDRRCHRRLAVHGLDVRRPLALRPNDEEGRDRRWSRLRRWAREGSPRGPARNRAPVSGVGMSRRDMVLTLPVSPSGRSGRLRPHAAVQRPGAASDDHQGRGEGRAALARAGTDREPVRDARDVPSPRAPEPPDVPGQAPPHGGQRDGKSWTTWSDGRSCGGLAIGPIAGR